MHNNTMQTDGNAIQVKWHMILLLCYFFSQHFPIVGHDFTPLKFLFSVH